ncbi:uncharacterized protein LOC128736414 [Sabethes cyaneus]|uniref:uncharacterized protein LOC128736414 n=1 Tax=Sabethes cyaneus TaxID=53552 RepID=UPI00237D7693|nr:uncharacterized protein LOC128736414 [Sabethes cyaneus]
MDLYHTIISPPSRSVILLAKHLNVPLNLKKLDIFAGEQLSEWFVKINPQHCVPTLVTEEGVSLWESNAIMVYLAERFDMDEKVYPKDALKRAVVNNRLCFNLATLYKQISGYYGPIVMRGATPDENAFKQVEQAFQYLEGFLAKGKFAAGEQITVADFALVTTVSMASAMKFDFTNYPNIERWRKLCENTITGYEEVSKQAQTAWKAFQESKQKNKMDLYYHIIPPPSRAVLVLAKKLKLELNLISTDTRDAGQMDILAKVNSLQSMPTLVDDGIIVGESHNILIHLAEKFDTEGTLYPVDAGQRARVLECMFFDTNMYKCFVAYSMPVVIKRQEPNDDLREKLLVCIRAFDRYMESRSYVATDHFTVADLALSQTVAALEVIKIQVTDFANVNRWYEAVRSELPGADEFQAQCEDVLRAYLVRQFGDLDS